MNFLGRFSSRGCRTLLYAALAMACAVPAAAAGPPDQPAKCAGTATGAVPADQLAGDWTGDNGQHVQIAPVSPNDTRNFLFKAQHEWKGLYDGAALTFRRTPTVAEMSPVAPLWARLAVVGKIEWKLVLKPRRDCGAIVLEGDWFPGELKFREVDTPEHKVASETASVIGIGAPIHLVFRRSQPSHMFLYAVTAHGLLNIDELFQGVATIIEVQFDSPSASREWPVTVAVGDNKLQLVARQTDQRGYIFRTDAFVPKSASLAKDQVFDPSPKRGSR